MYIELKRIDCNIAKNICKISYVLNEELLSFDNKLSDLKEKFETSKFFQFYL